MDRPRHRRPGRRLRPRRRRRRQPTPTAAALPSPSQRRRPARGDRPPQRGSRPRDLRTGTPAPARTTQRRDAPERRPGRRTSPRRRHPATPATGTRRVDPPPAHPRHRPDLLARARRLNTSPVRSRASSGLAQLIADHLRHRHAHRHHDRQHTPGDHCGPSTAGLAMANQSSPKFAPGAASSQHWPSISASLAAIADFQTGPHIGLAGRAYRETRDYGGSRDVALCGIRWPNAALPGVSEAPQSNGADKFQQRTGASRDLPTGPGPFPDGFKLSRGQRKNHLRGRPAPSAGAPNASVA